MSRFQAFRKHFPVGAVALEVFSIILGVGLALAAGQWMESRREAHRTRASLEVLASEIASNQQTILFRLKQRDELDVDLYSALLPVTLGEPRIALDSLRHLDLGIIPFSTAAYETMVANGTLAQVDIETSVPITRSYELLETTSEMDTELRRLSSRFDFYDIYVDEMSDPSDTANAIRAMLNLTFQIRTNEEGLARSNRHLLRRLAEQGVPVDTSATPVDSLVAPSPKIQKARQALNERKQQALDSLRIARQTR